MGEKLAGGLIGNELHVLTRVRVILMTSATALPIRVIRTVIGEAQSLTNGRRTVKMRGAPRETRKSYILGSKVCAKRTARFISSAFGLAAIIGSDGSVLRLVWG